MASAILASSNEPCWGERKVHMRRNPNTGSNPNAGPNPNPSCAGDGRRDAGAKYPGPADFYRSDRTESDETPSGPAGVPDDCTSFSHGGDTVGDRVRFNITTYSQRELLDLRRRLEGELELVRRLSRRIQNEYPSPSPRDLPHFLPPARVDPGSEKADAAILKRCGMILTKMMKQKGAAWFNIPVDVEGMGLHDYYHIVKKPMDLGTIRSRLSKNFYRTPADFAADVRLTFNNAILYNPQGHEVNRIANLMLNLFEKDFRIALDRHEKQQQTSSVKNKHLGNVGNASGVRTLGLKKHLPPSAGRPLPERFSAPSLRPIRDSIADPSQQKRQRIADIGIEAECSPGQQQKRVDICSEAKCRSPNPKPNDGMKPVMTIHERDELGAGLVSLTGEHLECMMKLLKQNKYVDGKCGEEVEIDISVIDNDVLWQLHSIVADYNNMMQRCNKSPGGTPDAKMNSKKGGGDAEEEDIDICDDMPSTKYPPVEIDKDEGGDASSSDSDDSSDSNSDSDSDDEEEDAQQQKQRGDDN